MNFIFSTSQRKRFYAFTLSFICFGQSHAFSSKTVERFDFTIEVESSNLSKENYDVLTNGLTVFNRYFKENKFEFSSYINYDKQLFETNLASINVAIVSFQVTRFKFDELPIEKAGGTNCEQAQILCSNAALAGNCGGAGFQELNGVNSGCLSVEHQSSWYYMNVLTPGLLTFTITPRNGADDYDYAVWGPFTAANAGANCPPVADPIRCNFARYPRSSGCGTNTNPTGLDLFSFNTSSTACQNRPFLQALTVLTGEVYILLIDNYSGSNSPFDMSFGGTGLLGCIPIVLPVEVSSFNAQLVGIQSSLNWTTVSEENNDFFEIEWTDTPENDNWEVVGTVKSFGNSFQDQNYQFIHKSPTVGKINYYRLSQTDRNGVRRVHPDLSYVDFTREIPTMVKALNAMGQEVDKETKGMVIYYFSDGSSVKVFN